MRVIANSFVLFRKRRPWKLRGNESIFLMPDGGICVWVLNIHDYLRLLNIISAVDTHSFLRIRIQQFFWMGILNNANPDPDPAQTN